MAPDEHRARRIYSWLPIWTARTNCDITSTAAGQMLAVGGWILQLLAWAFATLFVAGFTSAVRKT
jgi:hypothetical protein